MAFNVTLNGITYVIPNQNDTFLWGTGVSAWIQAATTGLLSKAGGSFTLTSDTNFGTSFGLISLYYKSASANIANSGNVRLSNTDTIVWAGKSGGVDAGLSLDASGEVSSNVGFANSVNWVSVIPFGADPTGTNDSTAAIQNAANAAGTLSTFIYVPRGTYKISSTIQNYVATWAGIRGEGLANTIFNGASLSANAFTITNAPTGFTMTDFTLQGPGQSGNLVTGIAFVSQGLGIADMLQMRDIKVTGFADTSFFWNNPIVSNFQRLRAQSYGQYGFRIVPHSGGVDGGTSTTWTDCYANGGLNANSGAGYFMNGHTYFTMTGCACDSAANSYYFKTTTSGAMIGCGNESNITTATSKGISITLDGCSTMSVLSHRTYNLPSTDSIVVNVVNGGDKHRLLGVDYNPNGTAPNNEIVIASGAESTIVEGARSAGKTGNRATISDAGLNTAISFGNQLYSSLTMGTVVKGTADPSFTFANTSQSPAGNVTNMQIRLQSNLGANGSLIIGNTLGGQLCTFQDNSNTGNPSIVQIIDPLNTTNGRLAFGITGSTLDYNGFNAGYFTLTKPIAQLNIGSSVVGSAVGYANVQGTVQITSVGGLVLVASPDANVANVATVGFKISSNNATAAVAQTYYVGINQQSGDLIHYSPAAGCTFFGIANTGALKAPNTPLNNVTTQVFTGLSSRMTSNTSRTNTTVLANEANLTISLNEVGTYSIMGWFIFGATANGVGGIVLDFGGGSATINAIATSSQGFINNGVTATPVVFGSGGGETNFPIDVLSGGANDWLSICGTLTTNTTGTLIPRYAQHTATGNATNMLAGTWLQVTKIS